MKAPRGAIVHGRKASAALADRKDAARQEVNRRRRAARKDRLAMRAAEDRGDLAGLRSARGAVLASALVLVREGRGLPWAEGRRAAGTIGAAVVRLWPSTAASASIRADLFTTVSPAITVVRTVWQVTVRQVTVRQVTVRQVTARQAANTAGPIGAADITRWPITAVLRTVASAIIRADLIITASPAIMAVRTVRQATAMQVAITAERIGAADATRWPITAVLRTVVLAIIQADLLITASPAIMAVRTADLIGAAGTIETGMIEEGTILAAGRNIVPACTKDRRRRRVVR